MKTINWGILSTGNIAHSFAQDFRYVKGGKITAVASRSLDKADAFAKKYKIEKAYGSYEQLLSDPKIDAVYIATPHNFHFQNTSDALKKGKAVLCEKPITINPGECRKLIELSRSTNTYLMEAMWTYFLPPVQKAAEWIREGKIGKVQQIKAEFGFKANYDPKNRLFNPELAGGALFDIGIYPIALACLLQQEHPSQMTVDVKKADTGVDHEETMVFNYPDGSKARLHASLLADLPNEAVIIGENGQIKVPDFFKAKECFLYTQDELVEHHTDNRKSIGYNFEISAVNQDLLAGKIQSDIVSLETSQKFQEIMEKVMKQF